MPARTWHSTTTSSGFLQVLASCTRHDGRCASQRPPFPGSSIPAQQHGGADSTPSRSSCRRSPVLLALLRCACCAPPPALLPPPVPGSPIRAAAGRCRRWARPWRVYAGRSAPGSGWRSGPGSAQCSGRCLPSGRGRPGSWRSLRRGPNAWEGIAWVSRSSSGGSATPRLNLQAGVAAAAAGQPLEPGSAADPSSTRAACLTAGDDELAAL